MSNLVVVTFDDESTAFEMRAELAKLQKEYLIDMDDIVVVTRSDKGKVKLHQATNMTLAGAAGGSFWGLLIGMIFLMPLAGVLAGTAGGAIGGALTDIGIDNKMMKEMGGSLKPGGSALCVLVRKATEDKVLESLAPFAGKGKVFKTSLTADNEEALRNALEKAQA